MHSASNTNNEINYNPLILKPSPLRKALFPIKILSLISLLITPTFFFITTFSDVLSKLNKDLLFALKIGIFLSFCLLNVLCKLVQAKVTYDEMKHMYCENNFSIKAIGKVDYKEEKLRRCPGTGDEWYEYIPIKRMELKKINIKPTTPDFSRKTKYKYSLAVGISVLTSALFVIPYITSAILENLEPLKFFSNIFYTLCFSVLILTFLVMHSVETSMMIKKEYWPPLDNSPKNQRLGIICTFAELHQAVDFITYRILNDKFLKKHENERNEEKDVPDHVAVIMNKNFFLSNALFFSNGESVNNRFGFVEILEKNNELSKSLFC